MSDFHPETWVCKARRGACSPRLKKNADVSHIRAHTRVRSVIRFPHGLSPQSYKESSRSCSRARRRSLGPAPPHEPPDSANTTCCPLPFPATPYACLVRWAGRQHGGGTCREAAARSRVSAVEPQDADLLRALPRSASPATTARQHYPIVTSHTAPLMAGRSGAAGVRGRSRRCWRSSR